MSDVPRDEPSPPRRRLRFSLVSLLLAMGLVGALLANYQNARELHETKAELLKARNELGELTIDDPKRVHVIALPTLEGSTTHRWRVHLPKDQRFRLCWANGDKIPEKEMPDASQFTHYDEQTFARRPEGPFVFSVGIFRDATGDWRLTWGHKLENTTVLLNPQNIDWLEQGLHSWNVAGSGRTQSVPEDKPLELFRVRRPGQISADESTIEMGPTDGVMVWIEPY